MRNLRQSTLFIIPATATILLAVLALSSCRRHRELNGIWYGTVTNKHGDEVPLKLELRREGNSVTGSLVNGEERVTSTSGSFDDQSGRLKLRFDFYDAELDAGFARREMLGTFKRQWKQETLVRDLKLWRGETQSIPAAAEGINLSGDWIMRVGEGEQQRIWRMALQQQNADVTGTIIPVSGDWGTLTGTFGYRKLVLHRFDGINARIVRAQLNAQGQLEGVLDFGLSDPVRKFVAERATGNSPAPPDPMSYTRMKNPSEPFRFSFPDLSGKTVSNADPQFKNKVVLITTTGSWCPNCHDEAPLLNELYEKYHAQGLEVVALGFEYTGNPPRDVAQLKIFQQRHHTPYPILYAGKTDDAEQTLSQLTNFGAFPTTVFIGRDGLVKKIHAGFEGPATGERHTRLKAEIEAAIKELLRDVEP